MRGVFGPARAILETVRDRAFSRIPTEYISPGASSVLGALGHTNAFLEFAAQTRQAGDSMPDAIVVGAGTCGTTAGLLAGIQVAGYPIQLIAVRCAEPIVCNRYRINRLTRAVLRQLKVPELNSFSYQLVESPENLGYAFPTQASLEVIEDFHRMEGIPLDTTYTSKVGLFLKQAIQKGEFRNRKVLYWHTFSPSALSATQETRRLS